MTPLDELKDLEARYDQEVQQLRTVALPQRSVLVGFHQFISALFSGSPGHEPDPAKAVAVINRLSYVVDLLRKGPKEPTGTDGWNALAPFRDDPTLFVDLLAVAQYGHFSELMPEVHRGYYDVAQPAAGQFQLTHASPEFADTEEIDTILAEISTPFFAPAAVDDREATVAFAVRRLSNGVLFDGRDVAALMKLVKVQFDRFVVAAVEAPGITESGFLAAVGIGYADFNRFRAAWIAFAYVATRVAAAIRAIAERDHLHDDDFAAELYHWISVDFSTNMVEGICMGLSGLPGAEFDKCMNIFLVGGADGSARNHGDGFLPPLTRLGGATIFCPDVLLRMMSARNVLYVVNRVDRTRFDELVSKHLEPQLILDSRRFFEADPSLTVVANHVWGKGEFDLLVYSRVENAALHVQAKAAIAPQGARMVQAVEGRTKEALAQLARFRQLDAAARDQILSTALGFPVTNVAVSDVVLSRSCFGTQRVWKGMGGVLALNLPLLAGTARTMLRENQRISIADFPKRAAAALDVLRNTCSRGWRRATVDFGLAKLDIPLLDLDNDAVAKARDVYSPVDRK